MILDIQFKLKSNPLFIKYLHENSYWYKLLNRNPTMFNEFVDYNAPFSERTNMLNQSKEYRHGTEFTHNYYCCGYCCRGYCDNIQQHQKKQKG